MGELKEVESCYCSGMKPNQNASPLLRVVSSDISNWITYILKHVRGRQIDYWWLLLERALGLSWIQALSLHSRKKQIGIPAFCSLSPPSRSSPPSPPGLIFSECWNVLEGSTGNFLKLLCEHVCVCTVPQDITRLTICYFRVRSLPHWAP